MNDNDFSSIDKLVEFGMGIAIAQQMVGAMNHALKSARIPGLQTPMVDAPTNQYHVLVDAKPGGPFTDREMAQLIAEGRLNTHSLVWRVGMLNWDRAENVPDVFRLLILSPPPFKAGVGK